MNVAIVGSGYVGLVTGACLARSGHDVVCIDLDSRKADAINAGRAPFFEPGLDDLLRSVIGHRLRATTELPETIRWADLSLIAVGTPFRDGSIDLDAVRGAARQIGGALADADRFHTVVVRSTVVPGTTEQVVRPVLEETSGRRLGETLGLGSNPEFLTEGTAVSDFERQDRIVMGTIDPRSLEAVEALYSPMADVPRVRVTPREAELIKYASNALLATAISFANELADLAEAVGDIDIAAVTRAVHLSRYLTRQDADGSAWTAPLASYFEAGCGYGGSCLPKDVRALAAQGRSLGAPMRILEAVDQVNGDRGARLLGHVRRELGSLSGKHITVLGFAFKPFTDDVRETPARRVIDELLADGAELTIHDPAALEAAMREYGDRARLIGSLDDAVAEADAIVIVTRWPEYENLPEVLARQGTHPLVVDGRRLLSRDSVTRYAGIGWRGTA